MEFTPLRNGLDFIHYALEHLQSANEPRALKYATLHLWSGIEILLKERLRREHWSLVFANPSQANKEDYGAGNFQSVAYEDCLIRLAGIVGVKLIEGDRKRLRALQAKRNRLEHFGILDSFEAVQGTASSALSVVLDVILPELEPEKLEKEDQETVAEIRQLLGSIDGFIEKRWKVIRGKVEAAPFVVVCPDCMQKAAKLDDGLACLFCGAATARDNSERVAIRYAEQALGYCAYTSMKDGGPDLVRQCPGCGREALVDHGPGGSQHPTRQHICFACGEAWMEGILEDCPMCGELCELDDAAVCNDCLDRARSRDD
jgi:hypothetical protein